PDTRLVEAIGLREAGCAERGEIARLAQTDRLEMLWAGYVRDALPADRSQMRHRQNRAAFVIRQQREGMRIVRLRENIDNRQAMGVRSDRHALVGAACGD